ncbi:MAG: hypothetical protein ACYC3I_01380 [Gemmataceae bacterium]
MSLKTRLNRIEQLLPDDNGEPTLMQLVDEGSRLTRWLRAIGKTAAEALAGGVEPPPQLRLRWIALTDIVGAEAEVVEYRRARGFAPRPVGQVAGHER